MHPETRTDHPVHELISGRWSPYGLDPRPVSRADLASLFEAARWAPSSYNEPPWRFIVATREDSDEFERIASCLVDANRTWARSASALVLAATALRFARGGKPNHHARHDLGLASAQLTVEATARGLVVHQMAGILPDRAREIFGVPEEFEVVTALAVGHPVPDATELPDALRERDQAPRRRRPLTETVFGASWGRPADLG